MVSFLLMKHPHRYDLPKGHVETGETDLACALRELHEETGISKEQVRIERDFRYEETYRPRYKRLGGERVEKTVVVFLGWLVDHRASVTASEHGGYEWFQWCPPHRIQRKTIDPLLAEGYFVSRGDASR
jgi:bis(5'-nucleosidyl)-tetraphosphatase